MRLKNLWAFQAFECMNICNILSEKLKLLLDIKIYSKKDGKLITCVQKILKENKNH